MNQILAGSTQFDHRTGSIVKVNRVFPTGTVLVTAVGADRSEWSHVNYLHYGGKRMDRVVTVDLLGAFYLAAMGWRQIGRYGDLVRMEAPH